MLVRQVDNLPDAGLDDELGALVAGEQGDVDGAALDVRRVFVHDGVHLSVTDWEGSTSEGQLARTVEHRSVASYNPGLHDHNAKVVEGPNISILKGTFLKDPPSQKGPRKWLQI